jgi:NitT/TauT family transport system permease protein
MGTNRATATRRKGDAGTADGGSGAHAGPSREHGTSIASRWHALKRSGLFWRAICWGGLVVAWELASLQIGDAVLPSLAQIIWEGVPNAIERGYYTVFLTTLLQLGIGFGIACFIAIVLGLIMGRFTVARDMLWPFVNGLYTTPQQALLPLLIIVFGSDLAFRCVIVGLFCFYFPLVNTVVGVQSVDRGYLEATVAFCTPRRRIVWVLWAPAILPHIIAGIRLAFGMGLTAMILAELWISTGTGFILLDLGNQQELQTYFAVVFAITAFAIAGNDLLGRLEKRLRRWDRAPDAKADSTVPGDVT